MIHKEIRIRYRVYKDIHALDKSLQIVLREARSAIENAYAPYSHFNVGAALLLDDGTVLKGSNQENAAYGQCLCAEQNVLAMAGSNFPQKKIHAIAITATHESKSIDHPISPCGACRQVLQEHEDRTGGSIQIILQGNSGDIYVFDRATALLPLSFSKKDLI